MEKIQADLSGCTSSLKTDRLKRKLQSISLATVHLDTKTVTCSVPGACGVITFTPEKVMVQRVPHTEAVHPVSEEGFEDRFLRFLFVHIKCIVEQNAWMTRTMDPVFGIQKTETTKLKIGVYGDAKNKGIPICVQSDVSFRVVGLSVVTVVSLSSQHPVRFTRPVLCHSLYTSCASKPSASPVISSLLRSPCPVFQTPPGCRKRRRDSPAHPT